MNKFILSTGLLAIGVAGIQSLSAESLDIVSPKAWSISGTLRGFYDDNYNIASADKGSWGAEVSPSISLNLPMRQTSFGLRYYYTLYYYNDRDDLGVNPFDQAHQVELWLDHAFNENWKLKITDHFAVGQEPDLLQNQQVGNPINYRINGDNFANSASVTLDTQWTRNFSTTLSYGNNFYVYDNHGPTRPSTVVNPTTGLPSIGSVSTYNGPGSAAGWNRAIEDGASLAGSLDRMEQNVSLDFNWTFSPETKVFAGYTFSWVNYNGNEPIAVYNYADGYVPNFIDPSKYDAINPNSFVYYSDMRNSMSHNGHIGLSHQLTANISLALSAGVSYNDSYNDPITHSTSISPSANASISYTYIPGSYFQLGVSQGENSTDVVQPGADGSLTQYQHSTVVYADLNHKITSKLTGTLIGRFVYATFEGGAANRTEEYNYNFGLNFHYQISRHFATDCGYNYDQQVTPLTGRDFSRNRVYLGLSANY